MRQMSGVGRLLTVSIVLSMVGAAQVVGCSKERGTFEGPVGWVSQPVIPGPDGGWVCEPNGYADGGPYDLCRWNCHDAANCGLDAGNSGIISCDGEPNGSISGHAVNWDEVGDGTFCISEPQRPGSAACCWDQGGAFPDITSGPGKACADQICRRDGGEVAWEAGEPWAPPDCHCKESPEACQSCCGTNLQTYLDWANEPGANPKYAQDATQAYYACVLSCANAPAPDCADAGDGGDAAACGNGVCEYGEDCSNCASDCGSCSFYCGDGVCEYGEDCSNCASDCGSCGPSCGNGFCEYGEDCSNCASDCGSCGPSCGNGSCEYGEDCSNCASDCGSCGPSCGNGSCEYGEDCSNCASDCGSCSAVSDCGNGSCEYGEDCSNCASDCGSCSASSYCGDGYCDYGEDCSACASDCGSCSTYCGDGICDYGEDCSACASDCCGGS